MKQQTETVPMQAVPNGTHPPDHIIAVDLGSTTTKAVLFVREGDAYRPVARGLAPTTVESPNEDVTIGLANAMTRLSEAAGIPIAEFGTPSPDGTNSYLATSSAGGGLAIVVAALVRGITAKSASRAANAAGGVILDVVASDDGRRPGEKLEALENLRPDMILFAGGFEDGDIINVVRLAALVATADVRPKFVKEGLLPLVYAGNSAAREAVARVFEGRADLTFVDNLRPAMDKENTAPSRKAIGDLFIRYVMSRAPGYMKVVERAGLPIEPTPAAVERILQMFAEDKKANVLMLDIGGATTDVFSVFDGRFDRSVSANLGMSYSLSNVLMEAGAERICRWLPEETNEREARNLIANKCIFPWTLPENDQQLVLEQAAAREALSLALGRHREHATRIAPARVREGMLKYFSVWFPSARMVEEQYVDLEQVDFIIGSGGVLSNAPDFRAAGMVMVDGLQPEGITEMAIDAGFISPHAGLIARIDSAAALATFEQHCLVWLGSCIGFSGDVRKGKPVADVMLEGDGVSEQVQILGGELRLIPLTTGSHASLTIVPRRGISAGAGKGKRVEKNVRGGLLGVVIDARGRPIEFPKEESEKHAAVSEWRSAFTGGAR
ncbi:MAG: glutamate mutase L [Candidatus Brocadiia bacterium]